MTAVMDEIARRNDEIAAAARAARDGREGGIGAVELCSEDAGRRRRDGELVRAALEAGATPLDLGPMFVTVMADLTYEVAFAAQFPRMSRPLANAMAPRCAHRHLARLLERAAGAGHLPEDVSAPWPIDELAAMGEELKLPLFVRGLLENRSVLQPAGLALLGLCGGDPPPWARRVAVHVRGDRVTNDLVERARSARGRRPRVRKDGPPRVDLTVTVDATQATLWAELPPLRAYADDLPELLELARTGALMRLFVNRTTAGEARLATALVNPTVYALTSSDRPTTLAASVRPYIGELTEGVTALFASTKRDLKLPLVLRAAGAERFVQEDAPVTAEEGEALAVILMSESAEQAALRDAGFASAPLGIAGLVAMHGIARQASTTALGRVGVIVREPAAELRPVLTAPVRRDDGVLTYALGQEIWLVAQNVTAEPPLSADLVPSDGGEVEVFRAEGAKVLMRVRARRAVEVRLLRSPQRVACRVKIQVERDGAVAPPARWRAALQPTDVSPRHLVERACWLHMDALPNVRVRLQVVASWADAETRSERVVCSEDADTPLAGMRLLDGLLTGAEVRAGTPPPSRIVLTAWSEDEPDLVRTIADIGEQVAALRFDLAGAVPTVASGLGARLETLDLTSPDLVLRACSPAALGSPGVFVASEEGVRVALCVAARDARLPRLPTPRPPPRDARALVERISLLRALDVAQIWPPKQFAQGLFIRRAAVLAVERALVGSLCGPAWLQTEESNAMASAERVEVLRALSPLTWSPLGPLEEAFEGADETEDPFALLDDVLELISPKPSEREDARHLLLLFYRRGLASPARDERAVRMAWARLDIARLVRLTYLALPDAFERWRALDRAAPDADDE